AEVQYHLGVVLHRQDKLDEAIVCFQKTIKINPQHVQAYLALGIVYGLKHKTKEAIKCFKTVVRLDPENAEANTLLEMLKERMEDDGEDGVANSFAPVVLAATGNLGKLLAISAVTLFLLVIVFGGSIRAIKDNAETNSRQHFRSYLPKIILFAIATIAALSIFSTQGQGLVDVAAPALAMGAITAAKTAKARRARYETIPLRLFFEDREKGKKLEEHNWQRQVHAATAEIKGFLAGPDRNTYIPNEVDGQKVDDRLMYELWSDKLYYDKGEKKWMPIAYPASATIRSAYSQGIWRKVFESTFLGVPNVDLPECSKDAASHWLRKEYYDFVKDLKSRNGQPEKKKSRDLQEAQEKVIKAVWNKLMQLHITAMSGNIQMTREAAVRSLIRIAFEKDRDSAEREAAEDTIIGFINSKASKPKKDQVLAEMLRYCAAILNKPDRRTKKYTDIIETNVYDKVLSQSGREQESGWNEFLEALKGILPAIWSGNRQKARGAAGKLGVYRQSEGGPLQFTKDCIDILVSTIFAPLELNIWPESSINENESASGDLRTIVPDQVFNCAMEAAGRGLRTMTYALGAMSEPRHLSDRDYLAKIFQILVKAKTGMEHKNKYIRKAAIYAVCLVGSGSTKSGRTSDAKHEVADKAELVLAKSLERVKQDDRKDVFSMLAWFKYSGRIRGPDSIFA
ncbi:tetratricopeptide repeat protein, partial [Candidatus Omnitrophota bacterium]